MIVFCHGMVKSASTFAMQIAQGLIEQHCAISGARVLDLREFIPESNGVYINIDEDIDRHLMDILQNRTLEHEFLVIKWHGICTPLISGLLKEDRASAISTYRNPIEIALSLLDVARKEMNAGIVRFKPYNIIEDTVVDIDYQIECFMTWIPVYGVEKIFYDDIVVKPHDVGERIAKRLSIEYDSSVVDSLLVDKKKNIIEFNKGVLNRAKSELDELMFDKYRKYWSEFIELISKPINNDT